MNRRIHPGAVNPLPDTQHLEVVDPVKETKEECADVIDLFG
jgi:hypothetical protein